MNKVDYDFLPASIVALAAGVIIVASLFAPWLALLSEEDGTSETFNAFQLGEHVADSLNLAFVGTTFNFLLIFGCLLIIGAILRLVKVEVGLQLIYAGALLTLISTVIILIVSSFIPFHTPLIGGWLCLCSSIAGLLSPKLTFKEQK